MVAPTPHPEPSTAAQLVRDFVNSSEPQVGTDELDRPEKAQAWLTGRGLLEDGESVDLHDVRELVRVREGIRSLLAVNAGHEAVPGTLDELNAVLRDHPVVAQFSLGAPRRLVPRDSGPVAGVVAVLLSAISTAIEDDEWPRLKVCARDSCRWAFYDASRNRSGRWCSMAGCGNIVKMRRAHRGRSQRESALATSPDAESSEVQSP
jgi:predicted RNA-binding Zn ribbon-like protein